MNDEAYYLERIVPLQEKVKGIHNRVERRFPIVFGFLIAWIPLFIIEIIVFSITDLAVLSAVVFIVTLAFPILAVIIACWNLIDLRKARPLLAKWRAILDEWKAGL